MTSRKDQQSKKRYSEDPGYRERKLANCRSWWEANKDEVNERRRLRTQTDVDFQEQQHLYRTRRYGLSWVDYKALLARQNGACAICKKKPRRALAIDHCHATTKVRGLLCLKCNSGLGFFEDNPDLLRVAIAYLEASTGDEQRQE